jgi:hypothetical protein
MTSRKRILSAKSIDISQDPSWMIFPASLRATLEIAPEGTLHKSIAALPQKPNSLLSPTGNLLLTYGDVRGFALAQRRNGRKTEKIPCKFPANRENSIPRLVSA